MLPACAIYTPLDRTEHFLGFDLTDVPLQSSNLYCTLAYSKSKTYPTESCMPSIVSIKTTQLILTSSTVLFALPIMRLLLANSPANMPSKVNSKLNAHFLLRCQNFVRRFFSISSDLDFKRTATTNMADRAILIEDNEEPETPRRITRGHSPGSTASSADKQYARNKDSAEHGTPRTDTLRPSSQYTLRRQKLHRVYEAVDKYGRAKSFEVETNRISARPTQNTRRSTTSHARTHV